jgi:hypothetical protein
LGLGAQAGSRHPARKLAKDGRQAVLKQGL